VRPQAMGKNDSELGSSLTEPQEGAEPTDATEESWLQEAAHVSHVSTRSSDVALPVPGTVVNDKYRLEKLLGRGGMGAVFSATHLVTEKAMALKWMLRSAEDGAALERFRREARAAGRIDHPNVVDVYDIGQQDDASYLVMELLRGESLRERLARGVLSPTEAVDLLLPAMRGVSAAHAVGVIHRDLKPDNIFLCRAPDDTPREAKVLDFGISAVMARGEGTDPTLTKEGAVLGTPAYMSAEQLEDARSADARSDVYAFGVILYEALAGKLPFEAGNYAGLVLAIANTSPKPLGELCPELPVQLEQTIMRALARKREDRYPDMRALVEALLPFASSPTRGSDSRRGLPVAAAAAGQGRGALVAVGVAVAIAGAAALWMSGTRAEAGAETGAETGTGAGAGTGAETDTDTDTETETGAGTETGTETGAGTETATETGAETETETEAETGTGAADESVRAAAAAVVKRKRQGVRRKAKPRKAAAPAAKTGEVPRSGGISIDEL